jgi:hypothetical protein
LGSYSAFSGGVAPLLHIGKRPEAMRSSQQLGTFAEQLRDATPSAPLDDALAKSYAQLGVVQAASGLKAEGLRPHCAHAPTSRRCWPRSNVAASPD